MSSKGKSGKILWVALAVILLAAVAVAVVVLANGRGGQGSASVAGTADAARAAPQATGTDGGAPARDSVPRAPEKIRIGSYNMAMFGMAKASRPATMEVLGRIGAGFDLLAMQEVGSNGSSAGDETCKAVMEAYLAAVDRAAGGAYYDYVRGDQYAFLFRRDRLELLSSGLYRGKETFTYSPLVASFRAKGRPLDFVAVTVHTRPGLAKAEVAALAALMDEVAASSGEPDVVCLGDFNADGSYYEEGPGGGLAGFASSRYATLIDNSLDTTVAAGSATYDRIETTLAMAPDWLGLSGVLHPGELWDLSACEGGESQAGTERALSDHYPVWSDFSTTADGD